MKKPGRLDGLPGFGLLWLYAPIRSAFSPKQDLSRDGHIGPHATTGAGLDHGKHSEQRNRECRNCQGRRAFRPALRAGVGSTGWRTAAANRGGTEIDRYDRVAAAAASRRHEVASDT